MRECISKRDRGSVGERVSESDGRIGRERVSESNKGRQCIGNGDRGGVWYSGRQCIGDGGWRVLMMREFLKARMLPAA